MCSGNLVVLNQGSKAGELQCKGTRAYKLEGQNDLAFRHLLESQDVFLTHEGEVVVCISVLLFSPAWSCYTKTVLGVQIGYPAET